MKIRSYDGTLKIDAPVTQQAERVLRLMEDDYIMLSFNLDLSFSFEIGDYIDSDDFGRFIITEHYVPTPNKEKGGYDYELRFNKEYWIFANHLVRYSCNNEVSWVLTAKPSVFASIFLQNINGSTGSNGLKGKELSERVGNKPLHFQHCVRKELYNQDETQIVNAGAYSPWDIKIQPEYDNSIITIAFDSVSILDAFSQLAKAMDNGNGVDWWEEDGIICFGNCEKKYTTAGWVERNNPIQLYYNSTTEKNNVESITVNDGQEEYATRIIPFGSTKNISKRYRKTLEFGLETRQGSNNGVFIKQLAGVEDIDLLNCFAESEVETEEIETSVDKFYLNTSTSNADIENSSRKSNESKYGEREYTFDSNVDIGGKKEFAVTVNSASPFIRVYIGNKSEAQGSNFSGEIAIVAINEAEKIQLAAVNVNFTIGDYYDVNNSRYADLKLSTDADLLCSQSVPEGYTLGLTVKKVCGNIVINNVSRYLTNIEFQRLYSTTSQLRYAYSLNSTIFVSVPVIYTDIKVLRNNQWYEAECTINAAKLPEGSRFINQIDYSINNTSPSLSDKVVFNTILRGLVPYGYFSTEYDNEYIKNGVVTTNLLLPNEPCYQDNSGNLYRESELTSQQIQQYTKVYSGQGYIDIVPDLPISKVIEKIVVFDEVYPTFATYANSVELVNEQEVIDDEGDLTGEKIKYYALYDNRILFENKFILDSAQTPTLYFNDVVVDGISHSGGRLNGMVFEVNPSVVTKNNVRTTQYIIIPNEDGAVTLPNEAYYPSAGNGFSLVGIDTSLFDTELEPLAEIELLRATLAYINEWRKDKKTYDVIVTSDFAQSEIPIDDAGATIDSQNDITEENQQDSEDEEQIAVIKLLSIGALVQFTDDTIFSEDNQINRVVGVTFKLDFPYDSPQLTVGKTSQYSRLGKIEESIENIKETGYSYIGGSITVQGGSSSVYIIGTQDAIAATNSNVFSSLRTLAEINREIEKSLNSFNIDEKYLSKKHSDSTSYPLSVGHLDVEDTGEEGSNGSAIIENDLTVGGDAAVSGGMGVQDDLIVGNDMTVGRDASFGRDVHTEGDTSTEGKTTTGTLEVIDDSTPAKLKGGAEFGNFQDNDYIVNGQGAKIAADGSAYLKNLVIKESLMVPMLIYNKQKVVVGAEIRSSAGGKVKRIGSDSNGYYLDLDLVEGEMGEFDEDDLVRGIWHFESDVYNQTQTSDDRQGGVTYKGFTTVFFYVNSVADYTEGTGDDAITYTNGRIYYSLRTGTTAHPQVGMDIGQIGNTSDETRQWFIIRTNQYEAALRNVSSWDYDGSNIYRVLDNLEGFSMPVTDDNGDVTVKEFHGTGAILRDVYLFGHIQQFYNSAIDIRFTSQYGGRVPVGGSERFEFKVYDMIDNRIADDRITWTLRRYVNAVLDNTFVPTKTANNVFVINESDFVSDDTKFTITADVAAVTGAGEARSRTEEIPVRKVVDAELFYLTLQPTLIARDLSNDGQLSANSILWNVYKNTITSVTDATDDEVEVHLVIKREGQDAEDIVVSAETPLEVNSVGTTPGEPGDDTDDIQITGEESGSWADLIADGTSNQTYPLDDEDGRYEWIRFDVYKKDTELLYDTETVHFVNTNDTAVATAYFHRGASATIPPTYKNAQGKVDLSVLDSDGDGWQTTSPTLTEDKPYLWRIEKLAYDGGDQYSEPVMVGSLGQDGIDGNGSEWLYALVHASVHEYEGKYYFDDDPSHEKYLYIPSVDEDDYQDDDYTGIPIDDQDDPDAYPIQWSDDSSSPTASMPFLLVIQRQYDWVSPSDHSQKKEWKAFSAPVIDSRYSRNGEDGQGREYIYIRTKTENAPNLPSAAECGRMDSQNRTFINDDYIPVRFVLPRADYTAFTDNPVGVDTTYKYEWQCVRRSKNDANGRHYWSIADTPFTGTDGKCSFYNRYAADGTSLNIKGHVSTVSALPDTGNENDAYVVDADGCLYVWSTSASDWVNVGRFKGEQGDSVYAFTRYAVECASTDVGAFQPTGYDIYLKLTGNGGTDLGDYIAIGISSTNSASSIDWETQNWGKFQGRDGTEYEYIYKRINSAPDIPTSANTSTGTIGGSGTVIAWNTGFPQDNFVPSGWTPTPSGTTAVLHDEYICQRKKVNGVWQPFTGSAVAQGKASLYTHYGEQGVSIQSMTTQYCLWNSDTTNPPNANTQSLWPAGTRSWDAAKPTTTYGFYVWSRHHVVYSNSTYSNVDVMCLTNAFGLTGALLRCRGTFVSGMTFYNNKDYQDWVIANDGKYLYVGTDAQEIDDDPVADNETWIQFNEMNPISTSVILAGKGYIDVLGTGSMFVGQQATGVTHNADGTTTIDSTANGWVITQGYIRHTQTGLTLTADGKLIDPNGLGLEVVNQRIQGAADGIATALLNTGINITDHEIVVTSDKFKVQNNSGQATFNVDEKGNAIFGGAVNTVMRTLTDDDLGGVLINLGPMPGAYTNLPEYWFMSSMYCVDLYRIGNAIRLDESLNGHLTGLAFPFFLFTDGVENPYIRTKTKGMELGNAHAMTVSEARALVGRKIYIYNDGVGGASGGLQISLGILGTEVDEWFVDFGNQDNPNNHAIPVGEMWAFECCVSFFDTGAGGAKECIYWKRAVLDDDNYSFMPLSDSDFNDA